MKNCYARFSAKRFEMLVRKGWTDQECADFFDVSLSLISSWKVRHPEFEEALKNWKQSADFLVEKSLFERAMGIKYEEVTKEPRKALDGQVGELAVTKVITKWIPPDSTAMIFWLKNRRPDQWRDKEAAEKQVETKIIVIRDGQKPVVIEDKKEVPSGREISFNT